MIEWMQRHKKWLVITIWISTIAFIGAGFVGWGAYDFGKTEGTVAKVGKKEIAMSELQREYSNLYSQYSSIFGDKFNQELAKQFGLEAMALQTLVQKYLILSFADDIGVIVTDEEVAKTLVTIQSFQKDGKFDKEQYLFVLKQNRITPVEFEKMLQNDLIVDKVQNMFQISNSQSEIEDIGGLIFMKDNVSIKILTAKDISVEINNDELIKFWESNKQNYLSKLSYDVAVYEVPNNHMQATDGELKEFYEKTRLDYKFDDGKIKTFDEAKSDIQNAFNLEQTKNSALKTYLSLKKGEIEFQKNINIAQDDKNMSQYIKEISSLKTGDVAKPFIIGDGYVIIKLINTNQPKSLEFENAKDLATKDYHAQMSKKALVAKAKEVIENNNLENIGLVSRESIENINGLRADEANEFLTKLFSSKEKSGFVELQDKVVAYRVSTSELGVYNNSKDLIVSNTVLDIKKNEMFSKLLETLEQKYKVISYMK
ncbi:MAG: peptidylprolyl isomerase [Campylobacterota bacterium]